MSVATAFKGEVMLAGWKENHTSGAMVSFWLPDESDLDAFRALTVRKGRTAGQRFMAVLVQIGDDEQPIPPEVAPAIVRAPQRAPIGRLALLAVQLCADPAFQAWLARTYDVAIDSEKACAGTVRMVCGIESRRELDESVSASRIFHEQIRKPFASRA